MGAARQLDTITITAGEDLPAFTRVRLSGSTYVMADKNEIEYAITAQAIASGGQGLAFMLSSGGVFPIAAAAAIAVGALVYRADNGEVSTTGGKAIGVCTRAAADSSGEAEFISLPTLETVDVLNYTADGSVTVEQSGAVISNLGAAGAVAVSLPSAPPPGLIYRVVVSAAQQLRINPGDNDGVYISGAKQTDGKYVWADDEGEGLMIVSNSAGDWYTFSVNGTWSVEP